jgi:tRNA (guanine37-N1)-methyltransferase
MSEPRITFELVSLFPEMFASALGGSLLGKAIAAGHVDVHFTDPRDFAPGKHRSTDDAPYGGGSGMVMRPEPIAAALEHLEAARGPAWKVLLTPSGKRLDQALVRALAARPRLALVCGRYEGVDERVHAFIDEEVSLGDFVLSGGETAALAIVDAVARLHEGVLGNPESLTEESFEQGLLEYPQYTRPPEFRGMAVPEPLLSGDHARIARWRRREALVRTRARRPDLFARLPLGDEDRALLADAKDACTMLHARTYVALVHHPVYDRERRVITSALTNLDLHDIARSARTYGLAGYLVVTPIEAQRELARGILDGWRDGEGEAAPAPAQRRERRRPADLGFRREALALVAVAESIEAARQAVARAEAAEPLVVATSARRDPRWPIVDYRALTAEPALGARPLLLLFGTGWGLAEEVLDRVDRVLAPIEGAGVYNHLSVRSAAAIVLDRLFGEPVRGAVQ